MLEGLVNSVQTFGLNPEGHGASLKDLNGVQCGGVVRTGYNDVHKGSAQYQYQVTSQ